MSQSPVPGIILAAGKGSRMGENKLLLPFCGKPILQHVIDAARATPLSPLILVLGPDADTIRLDLNLTGLTVIVNPDSIRDGYASSLKVGLSALSKPCMGAMFLLGDQPLVTRKTVKKLLAAFQAEPDRWVAPAYKGQRGNPVITPASWFDKIFSLKGDTGPRHHLKNPSARLKLVVVPDPGVVFDVDTPKNYQRLIQYETKPKNSEFEK